MLVFDALRGLRRPLVLVPLAPLLAWSLAGCSGESSWAPTVQDAVSQRSAYAAPGWSSVPAGFQGDRHPLLADEAELKVAAYWSRVGHGRALKLGYFPRTFYEPFERLSVAQSRRVYRVREFSVFLPAEGELGEVGRAWSLDMDRVARFLTQFHPAVSMHVDSTGRRAGPNGAFAILRADSETHADIRFRIHAEIEPAPEAYFTPAHFSGRIILDKRRGIVEQFQLGVPTDEGLNATLTVARDSEALVDIVQIERMELVGGSGSRDAEREWTAELPADEARRRLKRLFYGVMKIAWVPPDEALERAAASGKPIFAVVLWGALDAQSC